MAKTVVNLNLEEKQLESKEGRLLDDDRFLRRVAQKYYEDGETQDVIAKAESCSRQTVSKAIQKARDKDFVQIMVMPDKRRGYLHNMMRRLRVELGLEDLVLVDGKDTLSEGKLYNMGVAARIGKAAAEYVDEMVEDESIVALGGGSDFMRNLVQFLHPNKRLRHMKVVPMIGFMTAHTGDGDANLISYDFAQAYGSEKHSWYPVPGYVHSRDQLELVRQLPIVRDTYELMKQANIVIMQLWPVTAGESLVEKGVISAEEAKMINARNPVVDIHHHFFDKDGNHINPMLKSPSFYLTGLEVENLKERIQRGVNVVVAAGGGPAYVPAIRAVFAAKIANILVTDHITGHQLLEGSASEEE
jgi:DNA-binding transcriptional regulator LsrR (DeoR family)